MIAKWVRGGGGIAAAVLGAIVLVFLRGRSSGRSKERVKALEKSLEDWKNANDLIAEADDARRAARDADLLSDDGFKRPKS